MADLIRRIRELIFDPTGADQIWSDQQIQDYLDQNQALVRYLELTPLPSYVPVTGVEEYKLYVGPCGDWETDILVQDWQYQTLTPSVSNYLLGQWEFAAHTPDPVYLTGKAYDLYATAARLLRTWAAQEKLNPDLSVSGKDLSESQKLDMMLRLATEYDALSKQWPGRGLPVLAGGGAVGSGDLIQTDFTIGDRYGVQRCRSWRN